MDNQKLFEMETVPVESIDEEFLKELAMIQSMYEFDMNPVDSFVMNCSNM